MLYVRVHRHSLCGLALLVLLFVLESFEWGITYALLRKTIIALLNVIRQLIIQHFLPATSKNILLSVNVSLLVATIQMTL